MKERRFRFILLLVLALANKAVFAQTDTIKYVNGTRQAAKIIEINDKYVKFKNPQDTLGPTYRIRLKDVEQFVLKSGCLDLRKKGYQDCVKDPTFGVIKNEDFTRKIISWDLLQLVNLHLQISAEYLFKNRKCGLGLYYNHGLSDGADPGTYTRLESKLTGGNYYKSNYYGVDMKFFPFLHKKFTHFISLGVETGNIYSTYILSDTVFVTNSNNLAYSLKNPRDQYMQKRYFGYHVNNGFLWRINNHFIGQGMISLGLNQFESLPDIKVRGDTYTFGIKVGLGFSLGYAF